MRYWALSKVLKATTDRKLTVQLLSSLSKVLWLGIVFISFICLLYATLLYFGASSQYLNLLTVLMWVSSFLFLTDSLIRIKKVMKTVKGVAINFNAFILYAVLAAIAIFGQVPVIINGFSQKQNPKK